MNRYRKAFTLVELLTVISIIAILAALLMPSLGRAMELTRRGVCMTNQRNTANAFTTYASNHRSFLPQIGWNDPPLGVQKHPCPYFFDMPVADMLVKEYIGSLDMLYCPSYLVCNQYNEFGWGRRVPPYGDNHDAEWWYYGWPEMAGQPEQWRVVGYNCTSFPAMSADVRTKTINDDPSKALLFDMACSKDMNLANPWGNDYWVRVHWNANNGGPEGENVTLLDGSASWKTINELEPQYTNGAHWWWW